MVRSEEGKTILGEKKRKKNETTVNDLARMNRDEEETRKRPENQTIPQVDRLSRTTWSDGAAE